MADPAFVEPVRLVDGPLKQLRTRWPASRAAPPFENVPDAVRSKVAAARAARATRATSAPRHRVRVPGRAQAGTPLPRRLQAATQRARDAGDAGPPT